MQPEKASSPAEVILDESVRLFKPQQSLKADLPKEVRLDGSVRLVNPLQYLYLLLVDYQYYTL